MDLQTGFLGIIALATLVMAAIQIGVIVYGARVAQRVNAMVRQLERDLGPTLHRVDAVTADIQRATATAAERVEHADRVVRSVVERVDHATTVAHDAVVEPTRQGRAVWLGLRAAVDAFRQEEESEDQEPENEKEPITSDGQETAGADDQRTVLGEQHVESVEKNQNVEPG